MNPYKSYGNLKKDSHHHLSVLEILFGGFLKYFFLRAIGQSGSDRELRERM